MGDTVSVLDQTVGTWLEDLASAAPAPGGGAAAALNAAVAAALVEMVCNLTIGKPRYAEHEESMRQARACATALRAKSLKLASDDTVAFAAVGGAYKLPKANDEQKASRSAAIQAALIGAANVPMETAVVAAAIIDLANTIVECANVNVLSDVAVAAASARAALESAVINVEVNCEAMTDRAHSSALRSQLETLLPASDMAATIVSVVQKRICA